MPSHASKITLHQIQNTLVNTKFSCSFVSLCPKRIIIARPPNQQRSLKEEGVIQGHTAWFPRRHQHLQKEHLEKHSSEEHFE